MSNNLHKFVSQQMQKEYEDLRKCILRKYEMKMNKKFGITDAPTEIFHYTNSNGLIGILDENKIRSTHVTCVNDNKEYRHFTDIIINNIERRCDIENDINYKVFYNKALDFLKKRDYDSEDIFISCFSIEQDDLNQWRAYGGGECGYAIGFNYKELKDPVIKRNSECACLIGMALYDRVTHNDFVEKLLNLMINHVKKLKIDFPIEFEESVTELIEYVYYFMGPFSALIKHHKFEQEKEFRIATTIKKDEYNELGFVQKNTLLSRYFSLDIWKDKSERKRLSITKIIIGPSPQQKISKISVERLLGTLGSKHGFSPCSIKVILSEVPYRVP